jgi:hypothetical protein
MRNTDKREQRLMAASLEELEKERASIQRFADKMEIDGGIGLLDAGGVQLEREVLDWRIETFNRVLEQRPGIKIDPVDRSALYAEAAAIALNRRQAAEESFLGQSRGAYLANPNETLRSDLYSTEDPDRQREPLAELFAAQEKNIRQEWLSDLQTGRLDRHALDSYFAGRVDQHNTLIGMAVETHPHLRETLPPMIQYGQIRDDLQQQAQQLIEKNTQSAAQQQFRIAL